MRIPKKAGFTGWRLHTLDPSPKLHILVLVLLTPTIFCGLLLKPSKPKPIAPNLNPKP